MRPSLHEELLAHQFFLDRLARRMVADDAAAEDLRQETWLRALTHPPRDPDSLRAWLATVVRRLSWRRERGDRRRSTREREVARDESLDDGTAAVDRRLDAQAILLGRLRQLSDAQRVVLTMRYADDLSPQQIAARLGVSVNTVKARLRRGLETLRKEMDGLSDGGRASWAVALIPTSPQGSGMALGTSNAGLLGAGLTMATTSKVAAAGALLAGVAGVWVWLGTEAEWRDDGPEEADRGLSTQITRPRLDSNSASPLVEDSPSRIGVASRGDVDQAALARIAPDMGTVTGTVETKEGHPSTRVVALFAFDEHDVIARDPIETKACEPDGSFRLRSSSPGSHAICAIARIGPEPGDALLRPATRLVEVVIGENVEVGSIIVDAAEQIDGRAVWASGAAVYPGHVQVWALERGRSGCQVGEAGLDWFEGAFELPSAFVNLEQGGAFGVIGLAPRPHRVSGYRSVEEGEGRVPFTTQGTGVPFGIEVTPPVTGLDLVLEVDPVRFRVFADGVPLQCYHTLGFEDSRGTSLTSKDGLFDLAVGPETRVEVEFSHRDYLPQKFVFEPLELVPGSIIDVHLEPGPPTSSLVLGFSAKVARMLGDRPVDLYLFSLDDGAGLNDARRWRGRPMTAGNRPGSAWIHPIGGHAEVERIGNEVAVHGLRAGRYLVRVYPRFLVGEDFGPAWLETSFEIELQSGQKAWRAWEPEEGGRLRVMLTGELASGRPQFDLEDDRGRTVEVHYAQFDFVNDVRFGPMSLRAGVNQAVDSLRPGFYTLHVRSRGESLVAVPIEIRASETTDIRVDLSSL